MTSTSLLRRFSRDDIGAYAIEFALVGNIFIGLLLAIMQYGTFFMARQSLDTALQRGVRGILTGGFQSSTTGLSDTAAILSALRTQICAKSAADTLPLFDCSQLRLDVRVADRFSASSLSKPIVDPQTGTWVAGFGTSYTCPKPKSIVVIRAAMKYALFANPLNLKLGAFSDGSILLQSGVAFRVEPYQSAAAGGC